MMGGVTALSHKGGGEVGDKKQPVQWLKEEEEESIELPYSFQFSDFTFFEW